MPGQIDEALDIHQSSCSSRLVVTGHRIDRDDLARELQITRALTSLIRIQPMMPWLQRLIDSGDDTGEFCRSPRKWIVLHLEALRDGLALLN